MWYERKQPIKIRVWNGHSFEHDCSFVMGHEGMEVIDRDGIPKANVQIQLWTGCLDKEGQEIYEGDFLLLLDEGWIGAVVFGNGEFWCRDEKGGYSSMVTFENSLVVGNVFEGIDMSLVEQEVRKSTTEDKKVNGIMAIMANAYNNNLKKGVTP